MKKIAVFSLLAIFIFNTVGYYFVFKLNQSCIKQEVKTHLKHNLSDDKLTIIIVLKSDLKKVEWLEDGKEMRYDNNLYDVVKKTESESSVTFYCIDDDQETQLFADLDNHIQTYITNNSQKDTHSKKLIDHLIKLYFIQLPVLKFNKTENEMDYSICLLNYQSKYFQIDSPPPEYI
ncbi:hypothetical protein BH10BAC1_BH10BAC1_07590 [soil metagenome]